MIRELTQYIENNTSLVVGTTLFAGKIPPSRETAAVVIEQTSPGYRDPTPGSTTFGHTPFRAVVRGAVSDPYGTTEDTAIAVFNALHGKMQITLPVVVSGPTYLVNVACYDPYYLGVDDRRRDTFIVNIEISRQEE